MNANNQNGGYEGTPTKKHAMEQSPRKLSPKVSSQLSPRVTSLLIST